MHLTGRPDPVCGLTRTFAWMWRGDVAHAVAVYPLGPLAFAARFPLLGYAAWILVSGRALRLELPGAPGGRGGGRRRGGPQLGGQADLAGGLTLLVETAPPPQAAVGGPGRRRRLSRRALTATIRLDPDIEMAAISGLRTRPKAGSNTPAAMGSAIAL